MIAILLTNFNKQRENDVYFTCSSQMFMGNVCLFFLKRFIFKNNFYFIAYIRIMEFALKWVKLKLKFLSSVFMNNKKYNIL